MHIPDSVLSPSVAAATAAIGAAGFAFSLSKVEKQNGEKTVVLMGMMSAFVFAAQMVKFPVFLGLAGHLLGGTLAAVLLGPWAGACVIGAVLIVQCLLYGDGGLTVLGANFLNMGLIGALGGYAIYAPIRRAIGGKAGILLGAMIASWCSVILAAGAFAIELALGGYGDFLAVLGWMTLVHAGIGLGEALITGAVIRFLLLTRPDLIEDEGPSVTPISKWGQVAVAGLAISLVVAVFLAPFASEAPDGLEFVGGRLNFLNDKLTPMIQGVWPDYHWNIFGAESVRIATAAAGLVGTLVVFLVGLAMARTFVGRVSTEISSNAA